MPDGPAERRRRTLEALASERFDALIVGGGCVGAGIALHAAARGLRVALVERGDFAGGTSSRSTKLIHGGVRYLERAVLRADAAEFALVREALRERAAFFRLAPYLSRRIALLTPTPDARSHLYYAAGLRLYDLLAGGASLGRTQSLGARAAVRLLPALAAERLHGAVLYYDGQFDDARMGVMLALTAAARGATVANYAEVTGLVREGGRVAGAVVRDLLGGGELAVRARAVLNAAGPWADAVRALDAGEAGAPLLTVSSGAHVVVRGGLCPRDTGLLIPRTPDGRVVFILPWLGRTLIGTTDRPAAAEARPTAAEEDIAYLLAQANGHLAIRLARADVRAAWSGLRPLVRDPRRRGTAELARSHVVVEGASGLITVVGGKWTTYRRIAADAVAHLLRRHGLPRAGPAARAEETPILGAEGYSAAGAAEAGRRLGLPEDVAAHLGEAYGTRGADAAGSGGAARLADGFPCIEAEVRWAVRAEMAQTPADVLARRTRLAFLDREAALGCLPRVAALMAEELGWDERRRAAREAAARAEIEASF